MKKVLSIGKKFINNIGVIAIALILINAVAAPTDTEPLTLSEDDPLMIESLSERDSLPAYNIRAWDLPKKLDFFRTLRCTRTP